MAHSGIEAVLAMDPLLPSGALVTIVGPDGERSFLTDRGANAALSEADLPASLLDGCQALVVSGYSLFEPAPRAAVGALMEKAAARDVAILVDPSSAGFLEEVGAAEFLAWTRRAGTIFANESEALVLTGATGHEAQMRALGETYPRVVLKRGAAGAVLGTRAGVSVALPAPAVAVVDTTGAGDAFAAAFIAAEQRGAVPQDCLRQAIAAGSTAVQQVGGSPYGPAPRSSPRAPPGASRFD
jgi:sugar/nucleoside kinase (ribokinase family)